ncbi:LPS export ABC transporter periplasmic protein LptC [Capnocytophaga stomatis]|uniref:LPS export ABC transporter periplasmic protein LptC n=1 Tax=Capnocytophaga stomatis TaxID=1848904 RepID=A0A250FZQ9_9FLAO|nr:LPS export ABC transporter periplasmic protein LptC [Capnocytophaga stomatis]ATA89486.1 LPS export ABC transporter periplasmic protein LptC [Capnocytophaga stomatis]
MKFFVLSKNKLKSIAVLSCMAILFSCKNDLKSLQQMNVIHKFPQGEVFDFRLVYTDSTKVVAIITSPQNKDFSNQQFPYWEFPKGVKVDFFDNKNNQNTVQAKYGIIYNNSQMVELRDSVVLTTFDGKKLETSQLFWDQKQDWVFTEKEFVFTDSIKGTLTKGVGMDFDKEFSTVKAHKTTGILAIEDKEEQE